ncbi:MAG: B12-binding domain-containing radical SAM protein, partial [Desulfosarcinaceae bacterium]
SVALLAATIKYGLRVSYIDCLDRFHPLAAAGDPHARHGRGPYLKTPLPKPAGLEDVNRTYSRYGIAPEWLDRDLADLPAPPDLILVTSIMTYWYGGVQETISRLKAHFPEVPLILGGIYARLCADHAGALSGADRVVGDNGESLFDLVKYYTGYDPGPCPDLSDLDRLPYPAFDLQHVINYIPLLTSRGCPFDCAYCASRVLQPEFMRCSPHRVVEEIDDWHRRHHVVDFAFYDDALLVDARQHIVPILEGVLRRKLPVYFHTPNAVHVRGITAETASLMQRAGFKTLRLGLETTAFEARSRLDSKVTREDFIRAVAHLKSAGFRADQVGAYLLAGLPGQSVAAVRESIDVVKSAGITPILAHYTPIPHTRLWPEAIKASRYDLAADPIFCNNAIFPCRRRDFSWQTLSSLKEQIRA